MANGRFVCLTESPRSGIPIYFRLWSGCSNYCRHAPGLERTLLKVRVFYHDKCFDGASSAAVFSRFYWERIRNDVEFVFSGLLHRAGALFNEDHFDGDENAIVDFKYSSSAKITWWFDHHQSAFLTAEDAAHFEQDQSNRKFYDPDFKSCTSFIAMITEQRFGFNPLPLADLIRWTDIIDGAMYPDAKTAVEMKEPAMKLTMVIESAQDHTFVPRLIPLLASMPLAKICERYGGGGHARVGAISFDVTQHEAARKAANEIVQELRASIRAQRG